MAAGETLMQRVAAVTRAALASGALAPIRTQTRVVDAAGVPVMLSYIDALAQKDAARAFSGDRPAGRQGAFNPFLPYDPALFVADAEPGYVIILNKFPVIEHHILLITRAFVEQEAVVGSGDCVALARLLAALDGTVFFNGGKVGGGSQPHRHFQLIPLALPIEAVLPVAAVEQPQRLSALPFRHAFVHHRFDPQGAAAANGAGLFDRFRHCCAAAGVTERDGRLSPYNLLLTRRWMLVVPRTRECWEAEGRSVSINALGFGGRVLVRAPELLDVIERHGVFEVLASVTE